MTAWIIQPSRGGVGYLQITDWVAAAVRISGLCHNPANAAQTVRVLVASIPLRGAGHVETVFRPRVGGLLSQSRFSRGRSTGISSPALPAVTFSARWAA